MKKERRLSKFNILILVLILLIPCISAIEIVLSKENYQPQETLQAQITGNFMSLELGNVLIYEEGIPRPSPVINGLTRQDYVYYFYAVLPKKQGNYSLRIKGAEYTRQGELIDKTIIKNFTIKITNQSFLSINPGFILDPVEDFEINVKSPFENQDITANFGLTGESKSLFLVEDVESRMIFSAPKAEPQQASITIGSYNIPVFLIRKANLTAGESLLRISPPTIKSTLVQNKNYVFKLLLKNTASNNLTDIELSTAIDDAKITPNNIESLGIGEETSVDFSIETAKKNISGDITANYNDITVTIPVTFEIVEKESQENLTGTATQTLSCYDIGKLCVEGSECDGDITASLEGSCCLGDCIVDEGGNYSWIFAILLALILIVIGYFAYKKFKKRQKPKSPEQILKDRETKYEKRIKPKEVSRSLGKV